LTTVIVTTTYAAFVCLIALTIVIVTLGSAVLPILQALVRLHSQSRLTNAKPHDDRGASQDRHIAVASFRYVIVTCAGRWSPAVG